MGRNDRSRSGKFLIAAPLIYIFDLRVSDVVGDCKLHRLKYELSWRQCGHLTQPVFYYWFPKRIPGLKQYSPFCATEVFKTRTEDKRYLLGACDDYSYLIEFNYKNTEETEELSGLEVSSYPMTGNLIREPEHWIRHHYVSGIELVQDSEQKIHALVSMDLYFPDPAGRDNGAPFHMASLNLSEGDGSWTRNSASINSGNFPLFFDSNTSGSSDTDNKKSLHHLNPGRLYNLTVDAGKRSVILFDLGMRGEHCLSFDSMHSYSSGSELVSGASLIRFLPPALESSSNYQQLSGDRKNEKFQPLISCFNGHIYALTARYRSSAELDLFNHDLYLVKASSPERETHSSNRTESANRFQHPVALSWEDVCKVELPLHEDGVAKFSQCYDHLLLWDSEAELLTVDLPGL